MTSVLVGLMPQMNSALSDNLYLIGMILSKNALITIGVPGVDKLVRAKFKGKTEHTHIYTHLGLLFILFIMISFFSERIAQLKHRLSPRPETIWGVTPTSTDVIWKTVLIWCSFRLINKRLLYTSSRILPEVYWTCSNVFELLRINLGFSITSEKHSRQLRRLKVVPRHSDYFPKIF